MTTLITTHHIRWMIRRDMEDIHRIDRLAGLGWTVDAILAVLRGRNCIGMIVEPNRPDADVIKGFMIYELRESYLKVLSFAVHPEWQRSGCGAAMIGKLKSKLSCPRKRKIVIDVPEERLPMQVFLRSQGFRARAANGFYRFVFDFEGGVDGVVCEPEGEP